MHLLQYYRADTFDMWRCCHHDLISAIMILQNPVHALSYLFPSAGLGSNKYQYYNSLVSLGWGLDPEPPTWKARQRLNLFGHHCWSNHASVMEVWFLILVCQTWQDGWMSWTLVWQFGRFEPDVQTLAESSQWCKNYVTTSPRLKKRFTRAAVQMKSNLI